MCRYIFFLIISVLLIESSYSFSQEMSPDFFYNQYVSGLRKVALVSFSASFTDYVEPDSAKTNTLEMKWKIDFEKKKYKKESFHTDTQNKDWQSYDESSYVDDGILSVSTYPFQKEIAVTSFLTSPKDYWNQFTRLLYFSYPFGYIELGGVLHFIPDIISTGSKFIYYDNEKPVLHCKTNNWDFKIKLSPEEGYAVESIVAKRLVLTNDPRQLESCEYLVTHFTEKEGVWFPDQYCVKNVFPEGEYVLNVPSGIVVPNNGVVKKKRAVLVASVRFSEFSFPRNIPDQDFHISTVIPNYTPVHMQDVPQIKYVWLNGKIVPLTDELALAQARGHGFIPGVREPRFWLMAAGLIMIVCALTIKIRRYYLENGKGGK